MPRTLKIAALVIGGVAVAAGVVTYVGLSIAANAMDDLLVGVGERHEPPSPSPFQGEVWLS